MKSRFHVIRPLWHSLCIACEWAEWGECFLCWQSGFKKLKIEKLSRKSDFFKNSCCYPDYWFVFEFNGFIAGLIDLFISKFLVACFEWKLTLFLDFFNGHLNFKPLRPSSKVRTYSYYGQTNKGSHQKKGKYETIRNFSKDSFVAIKLENTFLKF